MKVLVVDDELVSRSKMQKIMENLGECDVAETGKEAIIMFAQAWKLDMPYELITLDIAMPELDGTTTLSGIRNIETEKNIPDDKKVKIVMVTSHADKENVVSCLRAGCNGYIVKPFKKDTVVEQLKKIGFDV